MLPSLPVNSAIALLTDVTLRRRVMPPDLTKYTCVRVQNTITTTWPDDPEKNRGMFCLGQLAHE